MTTREILLGAAVTQSTDAVASLLKYLGKPIDPLPQTVDLPGMVLVLSNNSDVYYTTTENSCSCPSAAYRPGQRCKHQRRYFPGTVAAKDTGKSGPDSIHAPSKWPGGFNGPVDPEEVV